MVKNEIKNTIDNYTMGLCSDYSRTFSGHYRDVLLYNTAPCVWFSIIIPYCVYFRHIHGRPGGRRHGGMWPYERQLEKNILE